MLKTLSDTYAFLAVPSGRPANLLLVGSDDMLRNEWKRRLAETDWTVTEALSGTEALERLMDEHVALMLLDPRLPDLEIRDFEQLVRSDFPAVQVVSLALHHISTFDAAPALPPRPSSLPRTPSPGQSGVYVPGTPHSQTRGITGWHDLVGASSAMQRIYRAGKLVARKDTTVLIEGESGTGKDLVARAIHASSPRERLPFVVINCAAIPEALLEAELFGYTKGSFTGAIQSRIGRIHAAHGGTLFLDEIGEMPYSLQSKLLRFLEQGEVQRIGSSDTLKVDCRVVAATNADLKESVRTKQFREDLYYRLAVFPLQLPPLRERIEDLDLLAEAILSKLAPGMGLSSAARDLLQAHPWPGNVRELRNVLERGSLFAEGKSVIEPEDIFF